MLRLLIAGLLICSISVPVAASGSRNVLFIVIDDLRTWLGYTGEYAGRDIHGHSVHTPNIDALAAVSTRYLNAYTPMPQCAAARTAVLFGLSPETTGLTRLSYTLDPEYKAVYRNPLLKTLPEVLSANGYYTAAAGKVFNTQLPERWNEVGPPIDYQSFNVKFDPGPDNTFINPQVLADTETHPDRRVADWGVNFLRDYASTPQGIADKPFFMAIGLYQPHLPWRVHQFWYDLYDIDDTVAPSPVAGDLDDIPASAIALADAPILLGGLTQYETIEYAGKATEYTRSYLAAVSHTDAMVGLLLDALASSPHAANTDIVLWSDNGFHLGEKFHWRKLTLWEQAIRVPLLISSPGNTNYPVGDITDEVTLLDLAPTVMELAGLPAEPQFEGAPLHDKENRSPAEVFLYDGKATIEGRKKIIDYDVATPGRLHMALYDLRADPEEIHRGRPGPLNYIATAECMRGGSCRERPMRGQ